ncbi:vesicle transport v-snare protein vti1 [Crepidotus variabilis]|uniref:Vesicle transport v-snare protein vti1 n=1 Tax=Crepidotus variabilis TaxID=179855 RepID=A0A9P6JLS1_9AGAR|nr:vesicle transport v-snare protein vti1 [Crepidotus variabilis]
MDPTPTSLFESYEQDFRHIIHGISDKLQDGGKNQIGEQRKAALRKVELELDEADDVVSQLEVEIQGIPNSVKAPYATRLKQAKADLSKYKKLSKDLQFQATRSDLLGGYRADSSRSDDPYGENSDRTRLLAGTETLNDGSRRIQDSTGIALETEAQGADILRSLRGQREQIENSRSMLNTADIHIDRASGTLKGMLYQMKKQRFILSGIGIFFVVLILTILYFKLSR